MLITHICQCCGKHYTRYLSPEVYLGKNCYDCSFWLGKTDYPEYMKPHQVVINGEHFMAYAETDGRIKGHGGRRVNIKFFDGRVTSTNNLWSQGIIPDRFRVLLPDNAEFIQTDNAEPDHQDSKIPF